MVASQKQNLISFGNCGCDSCAPLGSDTYAISASTRAVMVSMIGMGRGTTHGSCRPLAFSFVVSIEISCRLRVTDGGGRLVRNAQQERHTVGNVPLDAAGAVGNGEHLTVGADLEHVVVGETSICVQPNTNPISKP